MLRSLLALTRLLTEKPSHLNETAQPEKGYPFRRIDPGCSFGKKNKSSLEHAQPQMRVFISTQLPSVFWHGNSDDCLLLGNSIRRNPILYTVSNRFANSHPRNGNNFRDIRVEHYQMITNVEPGKII